ncbi:hypothetical protein NM688_g906 [Phlebia brevispora]|uniref:Uncharacterized protein n=1 Tax=Phlebia brevispora TaxID=194682 RepID=A0ACC1TCR7_9APHY|nr:hypothetical protein NM688_g906 [Phlebia brevispora]
MFQSTLAIHVIYAYINAALYNPEALARITWSCGVSAFICRILRYDNVYSRTVNSNEGTCYRRSCGDRTRALILCVSGMDTLCSTLGGGVHLIVLRVGLSLVTALFTYLLPEWLEFEDTLAIKYSINTGFSLAILVDLSLAAFLLYELIQKRRTLRFKAHYIQTIMTYTIGTGAVTVRYRTKPNFARADRVNQYNVMPGNLTFAGLVAIVTKLYANTMLANLNAREHARRAHPQPQFIGTVELSSTNKSKNSRVDFAPSEGAVESLKEGTAATNHMVLKAEPIV